jgi:hypothetical protein
LGRLCFLSLCGLLSVAQAHAAIGFKQNKAHRVIELSGLNDDSTCTPRSLKGKVISREFQSDDLTVKGFIVENADGTRDHINIYPPDVEGEFMHGILYDGIQRLTKPGRTARGRVAFCGVSGHVIMLDEIH